MSDQSPNTKAAESPKERLPDMLAGSAIHRKYHLGHVLSRDFAGTMYSISRPVQEARTMAVKVLHPGYALLSNTLGNIDHSRICKIKNIIIERDAIQAVVHEKPAGTNLTEHLREVGPLPPGKAVLAALQLLSAVHAVHWHGAFVGNLHSDSIFLSRDKRGNMEIQLANLGIGCQDDNLREQDYLAPEQVMGGKTGAKRSDIWAAGAVLYEMLMGRRPFIGDNRYAVAGEILLQDINFENRNPKIQEELIAVVRRAMEKDEKDRYGSASEMAAELMPFQEEFNEPMSESVSSAIRASVPPPGKSTVPAVPKPLKREKIIPTVRISHTPSRPPVGLGVEKDADKEITNRNRPVKQTKLGMPAISIPAKRIPLKPKEDTAAFTAPKAEPVLDFSAYTARKLRAAPPQRPPFPNGEVSAINDTAQSSSAEEEMPAHAVLKRPLFFLKEAVSKVHSIFKSETFEKLTKKIKPTAAGLLADKKKVVIASATGAVLLTAVALIFAAQDDTSQSEEPTTVSTVQKAAAVPRPAGGASAGAEAEPEKIPGPALKPETAQAKPPKDEPSEPADTASKKPASAPEPEKIEISFEKKLPKNAVIHIDDRKAQTLPIVLDATDTPVSVTVSAPGYETFSKEIVPDRSRALSVKMKKKTSSRPKRSKAANTKKSKPRKKKKTGRDLASNPFGG